ncbi:MULTISPECIES: nuclease-related domain-containing protein [unclassified Arthrobacter]|uniref:nuclease-related domain-containing protein n=1 Tax=unclassified Arthrobacter TaxID=235627 RepID=UPI0033976BE5
MGAGDRAAEQARMAAERAAKLRRQLDYAEKAERAWAAGAAGEARVAGMLESLQSEGWMALHDVHWPGRPKANLDHVLIGPGGVIVIDAKNWSGDVHLRNGVLRQNGYSREREVAGVLEQGAAVAALLEPQHRRHVRAWLCMVGQPGLQGSTSSGARLQGIDTVREAISAVPAVLDADTVGAIHHHLTNLLAGTSSPPLLTTGNVPAGPSDFTHAPGPATSLARWRTVRDPAHDPHTVLRSAARPRAARRTPKKGQSCLGALFRLALIVLALVVLTNVLSQLSAQPQPVPLPTPAVVSKLPVP